MNGPPFRRARRIAQPPGFPVPPELARQIAPEEYIPPPEETSGGRTAYTEPTFAGEWREEKAIIYPQPLLAATTVQGPSLTRPWPMVGFGVFVGNLPGPPDNQIQALLFALVRGSRVLINTVTIEQTGVALGNVIQAGAQCELVLAVETTIAPPAGVEGVIAMIWGSPFR